MAKPRNPNGPKQKLSPQAAAAKKARDERIAKTPRRTAMKAENQRKRRAAEKKGEDITNKDYDHRLGRFVSTHANRGNFGKGTKKETPMAKEGKPKKETKRKSWSEMAKKAKEAGWEPTERPQKRTLKDLYNKSKENTPVKRLAGGHTGNIEGAKNNMVPGKTKWSPLDRMSNFDKLSNKIQGEGKSKESADAIAYSIGAKKYGKAGMAKKAAAGRNK